MRKYNNLLLLIFIFLVNCNYKPILSSVETGFSIDKIEFLNTNKLCKTVLSLPMHTELTKDHLAFISNTIIDFINE